MRLARGPAALLLGVATACMTVETRRDPTYDGARPYSGTRTAVLQLGEVFRSTLGFDFLFLFDIPLCLVADTVLLPITIPEEMERQRRIAAQLQTQRDNPSVIEATPGEDPVETARRLFETCRKLTETHSIELLDCYAIDSRIVERSTEDAPAEEISGAAYKQRLVEALRRNWSRGLYITYRDPTFEVEGGAVRIRATLTASDTAARTPVSFLVGPGEDGRWRILEQTGAPASRR